MAKCVRTWLPAALLLASLPASAEVITTITTVEDTDLTPAEIAALLPDTGMMPAAETTADTAGPDEGFTHPLDSLHYLKHDADNFEKASLKALDVPDPWESMNRRLYHFNQRLDEKLLLPVLKGYQFVVPKLVRTGVSNFFSNLGDVTNLANSLLQLKGKQSLETGERLLVNTTVGLFGLWDPATHIGLLKKTEDFGQTLGHYGVGAGPYLVLPALGPSNLRDGIGQAANFYGEYEINFLNVPHTSSHYPEITALRVIDMRAGNDFRYGQLNSPFEYEKIRYVYSRARELQVGD